MPNNYDFLLGLIPMLFGFGNIGSYAMSFPTEVGVTGSGILCMLIVGYLLFVNPPTDGKLKKH